LTTSPFPLPLFSPDSGTHYSSLNFCEMSFFIFHIWMRSCSFCLSVPHWFHFNRVCSTSIHIVMYNRISWFSKPTRLHCFCTLYFLYIVIYGYLVWFYTLAIGATINISVQLSFWHVPLGLLYLIVVVFVVLWRNSKQ
jgi:hypothetical protein